MNIDEPPEKCAAREVDEEVGFDITNLIDKKDYIEVELSGYDFILFLNLNFIFESG